MRRETHTSDAVEPTAMKRNNGDRRIGTDMLIDLEVELASADFSKLIGKDHKYLRGNADENTRAIGNLHAIARPLRCALYLHLGVPKVREMYPSWDDKHKTVTWIDEDVYASSDNLPLLTDTQCVLNWLKQNDIAAKDLDTRQYMSREFAWMAMTAEIVAAASKTPSITSELTILESLIDKK